MAELATPLGARPFRLGVLLTLLFAAFLSVEPAMKGEVLSYDDEPLLQGSGDGPGALHRPAASFFTDTYYYAYLPLYGLSYWADGKLGATVEKPALFHVQNVLWHAAASYVVFLLLGLLVLDRRAAFLGALLFAVHPLHVESVAWIAGRKDVLSGFLCLVAGLVAVLAETRRGLLLPALLLFLLACFAKASAIVLPGLLLSGTLLLPRYQGRRREAAAATWPFFAVALVPLVTHLAVGFETGVVSASRPILERPKGLVTAWGGAVARALLPLDLSIDYPEAEANGLLDLAWPGFLLLAALLLFLYLRRRAPLAAFGIATFFVALLPFNNVFPSTTILAADRYLYLPLFGLAVIVAWGAARSKWGGAGAALAAILCLALSWSSARRFESEEALWTRTIAARDGSALAWTNRGLDRMTRGLRAVPHDPSLLRAGVEDLEAGLARARVGALRAKGAAGLVLPLLELGRVKEALERADEALAHAKGDSPEARQFRATVRYNKGVVLKLGAGAHAAAAREFLESANLWSRYVSWYEAGAAFFRAGFVAEGRAALEKAAALDRTRPEPYLDLASVCRQLEDREGWKRALEEAERRAPEDPEVAGAWVRYWLDDRTPNYAKAEERLARVADAATRRDLAAAVEVQRALYRFRRGEIEEAVRAADKAREGGIADARGLYDLGQIYLEAGRYDDAVACYRGAGQGDAARRDTIARALVLKAAARLRERHVAEAMATMREALREKPSRIEAGAAPLEGEIADLSDPRNSNLTLVAAAAVAGDGQAALRLCEDVFSGALPGDRHLAYRMRALVRAYCVDDLAGAEDDLRLVVGEDGKDLWARIRLAQVLTRRGLADLHGGEERRRQGEARIDEATSILSGMIEEAPDFAPARLARGEARLARGDLSGAKADYLALRERGAAAKEVCLKEAVLHRLVYVQGGDPANLDAATSLLFRALDEDPNDFEALFELGNVYHNRYDGQQEASARRNAFHQALLWYRRAMALNPRVPGPRIEWARLVLKAAAEATASREPKRAHELLLKVEAEAPDVIDVHRERVRLVLLPEFGEEAGMGPDEIFERAARALGEMERLGPSDPDLPGLRALYHRRRGWSFYLSWAKLDDAALKERARALAVEEFKAAVTASPDDPENAHVRDLLREIAPEIIVLDEKEARAAYEKGVRAFAEARYADAAESFRRSVLLFPESVDLHYALANALARAGRLAEAKEEFQVVANHADADLHPEALYELGVYHLGLGEKLVGRPWLERFVATMERLGRGDDPLAQRARQARRAERRVGPPFRETAGNLAARCNVLGARSALIRILCNGVEHMFAALPITIGRDQDNDLHIEDVNLSRQHCRVFRTKEGVVVEDLASSNGTFVNGARTARHVLSVGDTILIGVTTIAVEWDESTAPAQSKRRPDAAEAQALSEENRGLRRLLALTRMIASEETEERLLRRIVDSSIELTGATSGYLFLMTLHGLDFRVARNARGQDLERPEEKISRSIAREAIESGRPVVTEDAGGDTRFASGQSVALLGLHSVLCVPLKVPDGPLGALYLEHGKITAQFRAVDIPLVSALGDFAAIALSAARNLAALQAREEQLRQSRARIGRLNARLKQLLRRQVQELEGMRADLALSRHELGMRYDYSAIIAESAEMRKVLALLDRVVESELPVLIVGEVGTGKELIARALHHNGPRRQGRFVAVACASIPEAMFEREMFGGAAGADGESKGLLGQAEGGTLFLDDMDALPLSIQKRLLAALPAADGDRSTSIRTVAATAQPLDGAVKDGTFLPELHSRLAGVACTLPPLRERKEDIPALFDHFLDTFCAEQEVERPTVHPHVLDRLQAYPWPGNVSELRQEVQRLLTLQKGNISPDLLSHAVFTGDPAAALPTTLPAGGLKELVENLERRLLVDTLRRVGGNKTKAAALLGLSRLGLRKKLDRYGLTNL
jgi:DNA-binding NtrC family response regulator/tetratricopeptide (TPR) repeat protein